MTTPHYATTHKQALASDMHYRRRVLCHATRPDGSVYERVIDLWTRSVRDSDVIVKHWNAPYMTAKESGFFYEYRILLAGC
jgi:hypothetical protein